MTNNVETERYQRSTIRSAPMPLPGDRGGYWFNVSDEKGEVFRLVMEVAGTFAAVRHGGRDVRELAAEYGRPWVHGLIDSGRFERGKTYNELRTTDWDPLFGDEKVTDEDLRYELLQALHRLHRAQVHASTILQIDADGIAAVLGVEPARVREVLSELLLEGLVEPYAAAKGHTAADGACRITGQGLQELRRMESTKAAQPAIPPQVRSGDQPIVAPVEVFIAYSHEDESLRQELEKHLSVLRHERVITTWHFRKITAGKEPDKEIDVHLNSAQIILLLVSASFLDSGYCYGVEIKRAMERHDAGEARVIPVILRACDWKPAPFAKLQALPTGAKAVTSWPNQDEAFADVARGIRAVVEELVSKPSG